MKKYMSKGIAPIAAIIIGLIIGVAIVVGIVATQKKAPVTQEPFFVPIEDILIEEEVTELLKEPAEEEPIMEPEPEPEQQEPALSPISSSKCGLTIMSPQPNTTVSFPLVIEGILQQGFIDGCSWRVFEAQGGLVWIVDQSGQVVSDTLIIQVINWMTTAPQPIMVTIPQLTSTPASNQLTLVFSDNDQRDPPEVELSQLVIPVSLSSVPSQVSIPTSVCLPTTPPSITVISPNGGEVYHPGDSISVTWTSCNLNQSVGVTLLGFPVPSSTEFFLGNWVFSTIGSQTVIIPSTTQPGNYVINISTPPDPSPSSPGAEDWSDNYFTIN